MSEIDTRAEAVNLHLYQSAAAGPMANPAYSDNWGVIIRTGWLRQNDALMRALAAERDALAQRVKRLHRKADDALRRRDEKARGLADAIAERDAAQADAARLKDALNWTGQVYPATNPESGGAIVYLTWDEFNLMRKLVGLPRREPRPARAALAKKEAGNG